MKLMKIIAFILIALITIVPIDIYSQEMSAKEVVERSHDKANGKSSQGNMTMTIVRPGWTREVSMKVWSLGRDFYMIYVTAPVKDKGQVFMKRYNDMWNWMPSINRMIKIPPSMMGQSWMGSDFTNDDLVKMNSIIDDYTHEFIGEETVSGLKCHKIELIPKPDAAVVWGKIIMWVSRDEYYQMKAEYYDEDNYLVNTMTASEIEQMGDRKLPSKMSMVPANKDGHETRLHMENMEFNVPMEEPFFSQQNMKRVR
jgi:outer membrane lipoprotein-sorting protein